MVSWYSLVKKREGNNCLLSIGENKRETEVGKVYYLLINLIKDYIIYGIKTQRGYKYGGNWVKI